KKASSLLGDNYLEIDPGEPTKQLPDGSKQTFELLGPPCATYTDPDDKKSEPCRRVPNVIEATTPDQLLHRIEQTVPNVDRALEHSNSIAEKIDDDKGTIGRLVNDPAIADNVEAITDDARGFLGTLFGLKAYVGIRSEWNFRAALARHYVTVELHTRPDK